MENIQKSEVLRKRIGGTHLVVRADEGRGGRLLRQEAADMALRGVTASSGKPPLPASPCLCGPAGRYERREDFS